MGTLTVVIRKRNNNLRRRVLSHFAILSPLLFLLLGSTAVSMASAQTTTTTTTTGPFDPNLPTVSGVAYGDQYGAVTTSTPLTPPCIIYLTLMYSENFTGVIQTNVPATGSDHGLVDTCVPPGFGNAISSETMTNVTIAGRTGTLVLTADANIPAFLPTGISFSAVFTVVGSSGGLAGITGHGVSVGTNATAAFVWQFQFNNTVSVINVSTTNSTAKPITGYYTTLWQNGKHLASCFSPCSFAVNNGQTYQVAVSDYGTEHFNHWTTSGDTNRFHTVNVPGSSTTIPLTAAYTP